MKDVTRDELEAERPDLKAGEAVGYCLNRLFEDRSTSVGSEVVAGLTYEELIGALLLARDMAEMEEAD